MSLIPILDPGHGGVINNEYSCLAGGRKIITEKYSFYEGEFNRAIVNRVVEKLTVNKIPFFVTTSDYEDLPIHFRAAKANLIFSNHPNTYLISIHSNGGGGRGFEFFTSPGDTSADPIGEFFGQALKKNKILGPFGLRVDLSDGDLDKEAEFGILTKTRCPAVLFENLFFDNPSEIKYLLDNRFRQILADFYFETIRDFLRR